MAYNFPIIDSHVHVKGGDFYRREFDPDDIVRMLDRAGIARACAFSICLPSYESNLLTRRAVQGRENRLIPYAHVVPEEGRIAHQELRRAVEDWGFRGLKLHVGEIRGEISDELVVPLLEQSAELGVPVLLDVINRPEWAHRWVEAVPECKIILAHMGSPLDMFMVDQFIEICQSHTNVWLDSSYSHVPWKMVDVVRSCGADRLIFGSDGGPGYYPSSFELAKVLAYDFTEDELRLILSENIRRLIGEL